MPKQFKIRGGLKIQVAPPPENPFTVPPFDPGFQKAEPRFFWWSWHPCYPYWSKSCWSGNSREEAFAALNNPLASSMKYCHNKLIAETANGFEEVFDMPCRELQVWRNIADQMLQEKRMKDQRICK